MIVVVAQADKQKDRCCHYKNHRFHFYYFLIKHFRVKFMNKNTAVFKPRCHDQVKNCHELSRRCKKIDNLKI